MKWWTILRRIGLRVELRSDGTEWGIGCRGVEIRLNREETDAGAAEKGDPKFAAEVLAHFCDLLDVNGTLGEP